MNPVSFRNLGAMGATGQTLALLGMALLWTYRAQALEWLREFLGIWRDQVPGGEPLLADRAYMRRRPRRPHGALALVFIGQILFLLDLT